MSPYDQQVYDAGFKYIPKSEFLLKRFQIPQSGGGGGATASTQPGLPSINMGGGGGGAPYTGGITGLTTDFQKAVDDRQARLTELNRPLDPGTFNVASNLTGRGRLDPMGYGYYDTLNRLEARDPSGYRMSTFNENFAPSGEVVQSTDYNPKTNPNIRKAFFESVYQDPRDGISQYYDAEEPTLGRKIQDAIYSTPFFNKPQSVDQIMEEGYTPQVNLGILSNILGKADKFGTLPRADQAFITGQMGYTGPTVFGENTTGGSKDPFGLNVRSAFGNYAERVGVEVDKLSDALSSTGAIGGKKDFQGATFNPATGMFEAAEDSDLTPEQIAALNQRTKLVRTKLNFYREKVKERDELRRQEEERKAAEEAAEIKRRQEIAKTPGRETGSGGREVATDAGAVAGAQQDITNYQDFGEVPLARGGRVYYMDGGLADLVDIYD